jgi:hypothetical protein
LEKEENLLTTSEITLENTIQNGRFVFRSKQSLEATLKDFENKSRDELEDNFEIFYEDGFRSHKALVAAENTELQAKFAEEYSLKKSFNLSSKEADDEVGFISDPVLASVVNDNDEIIVNDSLYKIVEDQGVLIVHVKDSTYLYSYLKNRTKTSKLTSRASDCDYRATNGGFSSIDSRINLFVAPLRHPGDCGGGFGGGGGSSGGTPSPVVAPEIKLQNIISGLPECGGRDSWFQNLFGRSYSCTENFDNRRRIKTEFWDQSWGFYKSAGILTKTQTRTLGVWWESNCDEIHMGINKILLKYKMPAPDIAIPFNPNDINSAFYKSLNPIFLYNNYFYTRNESFTSTFMGTTFNNLYYPTTLKVVKNKIPFLDFQDTDILNIYIPLQNISGRLNALDINVTVGNSILSDSNIKSLYKAGFDFLKLAGSTKKNFVVTNQLSETEVEVLYFGQRYSGKNTNILKDRIFEDADFSIGFTIPLAGGSGGFSIDLSPVWNIGERGYTHYELDFYGLARRGNTWKGNRLIRN